MRKQIIENAAYDVASQVRTVEDTIDTAIAEIAQLQSKMIHVRAVSRTGVATGQTAFEELAIAVQALISARGGMARCHAQLIDAKGQIPGLRTVAFGDGDDCDDPSQIAFGDLRVVA